MTIVSGLPENEEKSTDANKEPSTMRASSGIATTRATHSSLTIVYAQTLPTNNEAKVWKEKRGERLGIQYVQIAIVLEKALFGM